MKTIKIKKILKYFAIGFVILLLMFIFMVRFVGDAGFVHEKLKYIEARAENQETTLLDQIFLRTIYQSMIMVGNWRYPQAAQLLNHYCNGGKDTLYFDAKPLLLNTEVQEAIKNNKKMIIFRPAILEAEKGKDIYVCNQFYFDWYYAFDVMKIEKPDEKTVIFHDNYSFQPLHAKKYTSFKIGAIKFDLNDGLIHIAYPSSTPFISYSKVSL